MKKLVILLTLLIPFLFTSCEKDYDDPIKNIEQEIKSQPSEVILNEDYQYMFDEAQCMMDKLIANTDDTDDKVFLTEIGIDSSATLKFRLPNIRPPSWNFTTYYPVDISILDGTPHIQSISIVLKCDGDVKFGGVLVEYLNPTQINYGNGVYMYNVSADQKTLYFIFYSLTPINLTGINTPDIFWVGLTGTDGNIWVDTSDPNNFTFSENGFEEYIVTIQNGSISVNN